MEITTTGGSRGLTNFLMLFTAFLAVLVLAGCAGVASAPVATTPTEIVREQSSVARTDSPQAGEVSPSDAEAEADVEFASEDDAEPAEEVEPSPLDELPETAPEISASELEKEKQLVAKSIPVFDIPMVLNDKVVAYVDYFSTRHKAFFTASLARSGRYVEAFRTTFEAAGIPKDLVYMAHVESAFKTNAYSKAKAKGIYQFMAATGRRYGLRIDSWIDERSDPQKSARASAAYLKDLHDMFGDWYLALAAYNAGEGKVGRSLAKTRKEDFWSLASTKALRAETRNYVPAILAATLIAKQPEKYGFEVQFDPPVVNEVVKIEGQTDLRILARLATVDPETLRQLNQQLRRGMTPPGTTTDVYVPVGLGETLAQAYATMPEADRLVLVRHQVADGESLAFVARHYGVSSAAITSANHLGKSATLRPGQELIIPAVAPPLRDVDVSRANAVAYRVRKGDTLSKIASQHRTSPAAIASASGIGVRSTLRVGQRLVIPAKGGTARASTSTAKANRAPAASAVVHTVRPGETLYRIADRYQVTVDQICALNRINADRVIYPGTRLQIRAN